MDDDRRRETAALQLLSLIHEAMTTRTLNWHKRKDDQARQCITEDRGCDLGHGASGIVGESAVENATQSEAACDGG
jgi:hypothetical protein